MKAANNKRKDTIVITYYPKCKVYICVGPCFENFHSLVNYSVISLIRTPRDQHPVQSSD